MPDCFALFAPWMLSGFLSSGVALAPGLECPVSPVEQSTDAATQTFDAEARRTRRLVASAQALVGIRSLRRVTSHSTDDCSGLVRYLYDREGVTLVQVSGEPGGSAVQFIYATAAKLGALRFSHPEAGDLVFFRDTYDRNRDGRHNDGLTHIGLVEAVDAETGTLTFIHRSSTGVTRERMNLAHPMDHVDPVSRDVVNDYVRSLRGSAHWPRLAGELFAGFASARAFLRDAPAKKPERALQARSGPHSR